MMKTNVEKVSSLQRKMSVEVPAAKVQEAFEKMYSDIQRQVEIKGFRKGKAPLATVKSMYKDKVKQDVLQELIQKHYSVALDEHKLNPISYPEFEFDDLHEGKDFSFSAAFDIRPEVKLKKYENLEVLKEKMTIDESRIDQVVENIRTSRATLQDVLEIRPAQKGDTAIIDFEGTVNGAPLENGKGENHNLELGSNSFIEGFEEGIIGMGVGVTTTLHLKFPTPYHAAELAGQPVDFKVTLKSLKKKVLPEMNEEFFKNLGGPTDLASLKETIRKDLEGSEVKRVEDAFKNRLLKQLVQENPVDVPQSLLKEQKEALVADFKKRMSEQGMSEAEFADYVKKWDKDFEKTAAEMIQSSFLVDALAHEKDLLCKKEDVDQKLSDYAQKTGIEEARIREFYSQQDQLSRLTYSITEEKVVQFLTSKAKVKEVDAKELKEEK